MDNTKRKRVIRFIIIYFVFLTLSLSTYTLSKYVGTVSKGSPIEVALWSVNVDTSETPTESINIISGQTTQIYKIRVSSTSEVGIDYSIILSTFITESNNKVTFNNAGEFDAVSNDRSRYHTLTFKAPLGTTPANQSVKLEVKFVQKRI